MVNKQVIQLTMPFVIVVVLIVVGVLRHEGVIKPSTPYVTDVKLKTDNMVGVVRSIKIDGLKLLSVDESIHFGGGGKIYAYFSFTESDKDVQKKLSKYLEEQGFIENSTNRLLCKNYEVVDIMNSKAHNNQLVLSWFYPSECEL